MNGKDTPIGQLKNIGSRSAQWLTEVGIATRGDLESHGAVEAYQVLKKSRPGVSLVMLYALQGALIDKHWNDLESEVKRDLKRAVQS